MPNRYNDRNREERNFYPEQYNDREHFRAEQHGQSRFRQREYRNREEPQWYETEQPEYSAESFPRSQETGRATFAGRGSQEQFSEYGQRGRFVGRGPKGYRRSDERIAEDVNERLTQHPEIDATDIEVRVESGEVILTGTVNDRRSKRIAEDISEMVFGVKDVQNQIKVKQWETESSEFKKSSSSSTELTETGGSSQSVKASIR